MRYPTRKVTLHIGGLDIKAQQKSYNGKDWSEHVTIPRNMFRKVVALGPEKVRVVCQGIYTDDYLYDAASNFQIGDVPLDCRLFTGQFNIFESRHAMVYARLVGKGSISFGRHMNEHYDLYPVDGEITMTVRE